MNWLETILVTLGISLDIFATMACKGAQLSKIEKKPLATLCLLFAVWQTAALYLGSALGTLLRWQDMNPSGSLTEIIATVIFVLIAVGMFVKAWKNETIVERRDDKYAWKLLIDRLALFSLVTLAVGVALGFLGTATVILLTVIAAATVVVVAAGLYVGYRFGYEQKTKAYVVGGLLLIAGAVDTVCRFVMI